MAKVFVNDTSLSSIANAIRNKNGTSTTYYPAEMADAINNLPVLDTSDATAASSDIISGKTSYVNGVKITGNLIIQRYYTGTDNPDNSIGNNGDIYLKVGG